MKKLNIKFNGKPIVKVEYSGKFTKEEIREFAQKESEIYYNKGFNGEMSVNLLYPNGWRSGYFRPVNSAISLYDLADSGYVEQEPENFTKFEIYLKKN